MTLSLILMVLAFVLLIVASAGVNHPRFNLGWAGLAAWALAVLLTGIKL